jgi:hypothetical protein
MATATIIGANTAEAVTNLNAGWYNHVSKALGLDTSKFLLVQGALGLGATDNSGLFLLSDGVPASASVSFFDASSAIMRSSSYQLLLNALLPESGASLATVLGPMYEAWMTYSAAYWPANPTSALTRPQLFTQWINQQLEPDEVDKVLTWQMQQSNSLLGRAIKAFDDPTSQEQFFDPARVPYSLYRYSATYAGAVQAINGGSSATIDFNSDDMNSTLDHTTAQGSATGFFEIFKGGASASLDQLNTKASSDSFSIKGTIGKYATLPTSAVQWFTSGEFTRAYNAQNDNTIWDPNANAGDWNSFFGQPNGSLARRVSQLVLVSDYTITVTSSATYSQEDLKTIQVHAQFGMWPFFSGSADYTRTTDFKLNTSGNMVYTKTLNKGLYQIWGVTTENAPN